MRCPECDFELNDNAKFCVECGAKILREKECPNCHVKATLNAKFCMECGFRFGANTPAAQNVGVSVGNKNVIAGDVIGRKVTVEKGAMFIHHEDETRRMVKCHICGRNIVISNSIECPCCGEIVCEDCYERSILLCSSCKKEALRGLTNCGSRSQTQGNRITKDTLLNVMRESFGIQLDGTVFKKYKYNDQIKEFAIPSGITEIAENAFSESGIVAVEIPSSVRIIHDNAFLKCSNLRKVILKGVVESIGDHAFDGCRNLSEISIPDNWEMNDPDAIVKLGVCFKNSKDVGIGSTKAAKWFCKAAEQGNAEAQYSLGMRYYNGEGVDKDYAEAVKWFRKAAEQGIAEAQYNLGCCYRDGEGVDKDYAEAVKWYRKAAEQGDAEAQNELGNCYYKGEGVAKDDAEAVKWYRKAAEQGHANAQNKLGICYYWGEGVEEDYAEAAKWYRKAAEQGHASAQYMLSYCYWCGHGVKEDYAEAIKWCRKASEQGHEGAKNLEREMHPQG